MTVLDNAPRDQYTATSGQTVFPYTFEIAAAGDIKVLQNGTLLNQGAGPGEYAVSGVGVDTGGNVTLVTGATSGDIITIYRDMAYERLTAYTNAGDFLAADVNNDFDRLWLALQQNNGDLDGRVLIAPNTDPTSINMTIPDKAARSGKLLQFNATTGNPEVVSANSIVGSGAFNVYNFVGDGATVAFTLGAAPGVENNTQVYIDGVYQQKNTYTVSGTTLTFSAAPPNLSTIEVMVVTAQPVNTANAASVSFTQAGSTDTRTVQAKLQESVSVKDFGAVGDKTTDDTASIQAAFDGGSKNIFFPSGTYKISSGLNITSSVNVSCDKNVVIDGSSIPASVTLGEQHVVKATGSIGSSVALTSNITEEDITITLSSTSGLSAGDYILVSSTAKFAAGWTGNNYQGWVTTIESVDSGTQITVSTKAFSDLLVSDTAVVQKISPISVRWTGGKMLGRGLNGGHVGFPLSYCVDSTVDGLEIDGCEGSGVSFSTCFNCHATRLSVKNCLSTPALGNTGYGFVAVNGTQYSSCSHSYFERCRHSVSGGGAYPARFIDILHNHSVDGGRGTRDFDCHEPCFFWKFDGNSTVGDNGGFIIRGQYVNITNNYIRNSGQIAIDIRGFGTLTNGITDFVVDGNVIDQARTGVQVTLNDSITPKNAVISNNTIRNTELEGVIVGSAENVTIIGNSIDTVTDSSGFDGNGIRASSTSRLIISNNTIGNTIDNGIRTESNTDLLLSNNVFYNITGSNWVDVGPSTFANTDNVSTGRTYSNQINLSDGITAPGTETGYAILYVDTADGDLKIKFGDGTVKTIVTDT